MCCMSTAFEAGRTEEFGVARFVSDALSLPSVYLCAASEVQQMQQFVTGKQHKLEVI